MLNKISCVHLERASGDLLIRGVRCRGISHGRTKVPRGVSLSYPLLLPCAWQKRSFLAQRRHLLRTRSQQQ